MNIRRKGSIYVCTDIVKMTAQTLMYVYMYMYEATENEYVLVIIIIVFTIAHVYTVHNTISAKRETSCLV